MQISTTRATHLHPTELIPAYHNPKAAEEQAADKTRKTKKRTKNKKHARANELQPATHPIDRRRIQSYTRTIDPKQATRKPSAASPTRSRRETEPRQSKTNPRNPRNSHLVREDQFRRNGGERWRGEDVRSRSCLNIYFRTSGSSAFCLAMGRET